MSTDTQRIKERIDIVEVIGSYIELERAGSSLKAKCPFHNEKTPSFFVSPDRGLYYCFGCGAKGDVFTFVQEFEGLDFYGALKMLADRAGVQIESVDEDTREEKNRLFKILERATVFYQGQQENNEELHTYLQSRGVNEDTVRSFRLGYAPDEWRALHTHLKEKDVSDEDMERVGLIKKNDSGRYYDRFRNRLIFPIADSAGRIVGFSGRLLGEDENAPKYLNSPETDLFKKSFVLYGYDKAKQPMRKNDFCILVEGQMDLILSHQAGYPNTVAVSGTSLTAHHLKMVKRMTENVLLAFDSDTAGRESEQKAAQVALAMGMDVKAVTLPEDADPADIITSDEESWKSYVRDAEHVIEKHLTHIGNDTSDRRSFWKGVRREILPLVARIPDSIDRSHFISVVHEKTDIPEHSITEELEVIRKEQSGEKKKGVARRPENGASQSTQTKRSGVSRKQSVARKLIGILRWQESLDSPVIDVKDVRSDVEEILSEDEIEKNISEENTFKAEVAYSKRDDFKREVDELLLYLKEEQAREEYNKAMHALKESERTGETEKQNELLKRCQELSTQIDTLREQRNDKLSI